MDELDQIRQVKNILWPFLPLMIIAVVAISGCVYVLISSAQPKKQSLQVTVGDGQQPEEKRRKAA